ncbi:MAG TPA: M4 family metallopeptidase, partial [Candidatus Krumholzibacteria bacterium]|nr:M4 family metallopeptidase [Candidatus Krumholzibacteria bacterium]
WPFQSSAADTIFRLHRDAEGGIIAFERDGYIAQKGTAALTMEQAEAKSLDFLLLRGEEIALPLGSELEVASVTQDQLGHSRTFLLQTFHGVPVYGKGAIVNLDAAGEVKFASIDVERRLEGAGPGPVDAEQARTFALDRSKFDVPWEMDAIVGEAELFLLPPLPTIGVAPADASWAWKVDVASDPDIWFARTYFIDTKDMRLLRSFSGLCGVDKRVYDCAKEPGNDNCYIDSEGIEGYFHGRSEAAPVRGPHNRTEMAQYMSTDVDDIHAMGQAMHEFVQASFGLNGANNMGGIRDEPGEQYQTRYYVHAEGGSGDGASFCPGGALSSPTQSIALCHDEIYEDVVGHEYGHALSNWAFTHAGGVLALGVDPSSPSARALAESFSDVLGEAFEFDQINSTDWLVGTGQAEPEPDRDLSAPNSLADSYGRFHAQRSYDAYYNCSNSTDGGGYYLNSTVYSHAFYLAVEGGEFNGCSVSPQGMEFAKQVYHRAWRTYFDMSQSYTGAYTKFLQACGDLYSPSQCAELQKALQAVEADQLGICADPAGAAGEQAPACAVNHAADAATTTADGTPVATFQAHETIFVTVTAGTPDRTIDVHLVAPDSSRAIWFDLAAASEASGTAIIGSDGHLFAPILAAGTEGAFDLIIDGNRDGVYQPWADTVLPIEVSGFATSVLDVVDPRNLVQSVSPNPFNPSTAFRLRLPQASTVSLNIYDVSGRLIRTLLAQASMDMGEHQVRWDGRDGGGSPVAAGVYHWRLESGAVAERGKFLLLK